MVERSIFAGRWFLPRKCKMKHRKSWKQNTAKVGSKTPQKLEVKYRKSLQRNATNVCNGNRVSFVFYAPYSANNIDDYWHFKTQTATNLAVTVFHTSFC